MSKAYECDRCGMLFYLSWGYTYEYIYKLPVDAYSRTHEQTISEDAIKDKLVGKKQKRKEIIDDIIVDKDEIIESEDKE